MLLPKLIALALAALFSFAAPIVAALQPPQHLTTPSGHRIPLALIRRHLPDTPEHDLPSLLYEHKHASHLSSLSLHRRLDPRALSPQVLNPSVSAIRHRLNGREYRPPKGPSIRFSHSHAFVYDHASATLLSAWGPRLTLIPLNLKTHPSILVNIHAPHASSNSIHGLSSRRLQNLSDESQTGNFRPGFKTERHVFFDVGFGFDSSFCAQYTSGDGPNATQIVHAAGVLAHTMSLTPIVSVRIGDILGYCDCDKPRVVVDRFAPPPAARLRACEADDKCQTPSVRLHRFRNAWRNLVKDSISDSAYLLTSSFQSKPGGVVGAAWVASACSTFGFGWVLGNHPVILAHEMGHTLGAPHDSTGLMKSSLSLFQTAQYTPKSLHSIDSFLARLSGQSCLQARHRGSGVERSFSGFTRIVRGGRSNGAVIEGTGMDVGDVRVHGEVTVVMMHVQKFAKGALGAGLRVTTLYRSAEKGFPFSYNNSFVTVYVRASHLHDFRAGGAVAVASLRKDKEQDDVVALMVRRSTGRFYYVVGYDVAHEVGVVRGGWSPVRNLPLNIGGTVVAMGATAADLRGNGQIDLVLVYVVKEAVDGVDTGKVFARYVVGQDMSGDTALPKRGWRPPVDVPIPKDVLQSIGDISVTVWTTASSAATDAASSKPELPSLLFYASYLDAGTKQWRHRVTIARGVVGSSSSSFTTFRPPRLPVLKGPTRVTGGVALTRLLSATAPVPTSVVYLSRMFSNGGTSHWLDVGEGLLTREQAVDPGVPTQLALSLGEDVVPRDTCARCYLSPAHATLCEAKVRSCFSRRAFGRLEKVFSTARQATTTKETQLLPRSDVIFCVGFHALFVANTGARCQWDAKRTAILAEGVRTLMLSDLDGGVNDGGAVEFTASAGVTRTVDASGGGLGGTQRVPSTVRVRVFSARFVRWAIVNQALRKLRKRKDFVSFFSSRTQIFRKNKNVYVVVLRFTKNFQAEFLRDVNDGLSEGGRR